MQDLRYAFRQLLKSPAFTLIAVLTLALGIGANIALYTLADAILLRPRPGVGDPGRVVWVTELENGHPSNINYLDFIDVRNDATAFESLSLVGDMSFSVTLGKESEVARGQIVSGEFFSMLRTPFALGRGFTRADDSVAAPQPVVVISHDFWQRQLGGDLGVVGKQLVVNGKSLTIVGVTEPHFNGPDHDDRPRVLWVPVALTSSLLPAWREMFTSRGFRAHRAMGRLKPGSSIDRANTEVATIVSRILATDSVRRGVNTGGVFSARAGVPPGGESEIGVIGIGALGVTGIILLIACANVSNLLLGRGVARRREIGIRLSIGAARGRLLRQLLTESLLLAALATVTGMLLSAWLVDVMLAFVIPLPLQVAMNWRMLVAAAVAAFATAAIVGIVPAFDATRGDLTVALKDGTPGSDRRRAGLQGTFVIAQVALSLLLLVTSGLFLRSLDKANRVEVGFDASASVLAVSFDLGMRTYTDQQANAFIESLLDRAAGLPGVQSVSTSNQVPLGNRTTSTGMISADSPQNELPAIMSVVRPRYFRTIGVRMLKGRDFTDADRAGAPGVAIVSAGLAESMWPDQNPLGKRLSLEGPTGPFLTVVGVTDQARIVKLNSRRVPSAVYLPQRQQPSWKSFALFVRSTGDASLLRDAVRERIHALDPYIAIESEKTLAQVRNESVAEQRTVSVILAIAGSLATLLVAVGIYGVMAFAVGRRTREIGVRVALGAVSAQVVLLFVKQGMRQAGVGVGIGLVLAFAVTRLLSNVLFGITPTDAVTFAGVSLMLGAVAFLACWLPARRAATVDPMVALRSE